MSEHEQSIGLSSDWYTPPEYFEALGLTFDLDPAGAHGQKDDAQYPHNLARTCLAENAFVRHVASHAVTKCSVRNIGPSSRELNQ
jgi:hypothetical protein